MRVHHLVTPSLLHPTPIACADRYEEAQAIADEIGGVVSLHLCEEPCPACDWRNPEARCASHGLGDLGRYGVAG